MLKKYCVIENGNGISLETLRSESLKWEIPSSHKNDNIITNKAILITHARGVSVNCDRDTVVTRLRSRRVVKANRPALFRLSTTYPTSLSGILSFSNRSPILWNALQSAVPNLCSLSLPKFKKVFTKLLLDSPKYISYAVADVNRYTWCGSHILLSFLHFLVFSFFS